MTDDINIRCEHLLYPKWRGLPVVPSKAAFSELMFLGMSLADVVEVLDKGYDYSQSRRKQNVFEKCVRRHDKTVKVVVVKDYSVSLGTEVWVVVHAG